MADINLLPWREQKREQNKKIFTSMVLASIVVSVVIVFLVSSYANSLVSNQLTRNKMLDQENQILDGQIAEIKMLKVVRQGLVSRMAIVQNLQSTRTLMVHLFDELIKVMPSGIFLTKLERKNDLVTLWGYTDSNTSVSDLMDNMEKSSYMMSPVLIEIKNTDDSKQRNSTHAKSVDEHSPENEFSLNFVLKPKQLGM